MNAQGLNWSSLPNSGNNREKGVRSFRIVGLDVFFLPAVTSGPGHQLLGGSRSLWSNWSNQS